MVKEEFEFLNKIHHNAQMIQLKNIAEHSKGNAARYVFDHNSRLHCADAINYIHANIHEDHAKAEDTGYGSVYFLMGKHYWEGSNISQDNIAKFEESGIKAGSVMGLVALVDFHQSIGTK